MTHGPLPYTRVIATDRASAKTERLIDWLFESPDNRIIVTPHGQRGVEHILRRCLERMRTQSSGGRYLHAFPLTREYWVKRIITVQAFGLGQYFRDRTFLQVGLDDAEAVIANALGLRPDVMTMTAAPTTDLRNGGV